MKLLKSLYKKIINLKTSLFKNCSFVNYNVYNNIFNHQHVSSLPKGSAAENIVVNLLGVFFFFWFLLAKSFLHPYL